MSCSSTTSIIIPRHPKYKIIPFAKRSQIHVKTYNQNRCLPKSRSRGFNPLLVSSTAKTMPVEPLTSGASHRINALFSLRALRSLLLMLNAVVLLLILPFRGQRRVSAANSVDKVGKDEKQQEIGRRGSPAGVIRAMLPWRNAVAALDQEDEAAARRSQAIRRVFQVDDGDGDTAREFSLFSTARGDTLFTQSWTPISVKSRGLVVLLHGLNEHSGRYTSFAKRLNANGFKVYGMDWVGHGGSDGLHAFVHSLDDAVVDLKMFLEKVLAENPGLPCFCFGHSTGGAIILKAVLDPKVEAQVSGIIMTSPAIGIQPTHPIIVVLAPLISFLVPRYQISVSNKKGRPVSRDPDALVAKYSDPLVHTGPIRVRTGCELLRITSYLQQNVNRFTVPFLVLHGTDDTVTDPLASQKLYEEAASTDKTIKLFQGLLHDLLFEPERDAITDDIIQWLNCRVE